MTEEDVKNYIRDSYGIEYDRPWDDEAYVFRHPENRKWFGLIMHVPLSRLTHDADDTEDVAVMNVKCAPAALGSFTDGEAVFPAYHMNREHWLSIRLERIDAERLYALIDLSFSLTLIKSRRR